MTTATDSEPMDVYVAPGHRDEISSYQRLGASSSERKSSQFADT
jgi:hypothetical protein